MGKTPQFTEPRAPEALPDFQTPQLAQAVEALQPAQIDELEFGVVGLDANHVVRVYNRAEAQLSGMKDRPGKGRLFFLDVAPCMNNAYFKGRIDEALRAGRLDIAFSFMGDFSDAGRELDVRVQSGSDGGYWLFIRRPDPAG